PMPEIEHNAPRFYYRVYWRRDIDGSASNIEDVTDWKQSSVVIPNQPTFERYRIKVVAINERGEANVAAQEVNGWSGEDRPLDAPTNFTLKQIIDAKSALLSWNPINPFNVRGHFKGYQRTTQSQQFVAPDKPKFTWYQVNSDSGFPAVKLVWHPNVDGRPGSHFYAQYRRKGEPMFESTPNELYEDFIIVRGLDDIETYDMRIVAVDGDHTTASDTQEVTLHPQDGPYVRYKESVATSGWFIGMLLAVAFLLIVLILVCVIKKNRGGKYAVHEREALHGRHDYPDEVNAFPEYNQAAGRVPKSSISSDFRMPHESDTDSMAEYGDGDAGEFAEDGSFIGQYRPSRKEVTPSVPEPGTLV
ncbi:hypothetical protein QYM36_003051, partial [Artemia franciscana]